MKMYFPYEENMVQFEIGTTGVIRLNSFSECPYFIYAIINNTLQINLSENNLSCFLKDHKHDEAIKC